MRIGDEYKCDLCERHFVGKEMVEGELCLFNGTEENYPQVCRRCMGAVRNTIGHLKPKPKDEKKE